MARFMIKEFQCKQCEAVNEYYLDRSEDVMEEAPDEECKSCGAAAENLVLALSAIDQHISWSKWRAV